LRRSANSARLTQQVAERLGDVTSAAEAATENKPGIEH
jgi:hypothetical protein